MDSCKALHAVEFRALVRTLSAWRTGFMSLRRLPAFFASPAKTPPGRFPSAAGPDRIPAPVFYSGSQCVSGGAVHHHRRTRGCGGPVLLYYLPDEPIECRFFSGQYTDASSVVDFLQHAAKYFLPHAAHGRYAMAFQMDSGHSKQIRRHGDKDSRLRPASLSRAGTSMGRKCRRLLLLRMVRFQKDQPLQGTDRRFLRLAGI